MDPWLLSIFAGLVASGFFIFLSASVGLIAREGATFGSVAFSRLLAVTIGGGLAYGLSRIDYRLLRRYALSFLCAGVLLSLGVFLPGIGIEHGGAKRWVGAFGFTFQPSELLKIAFVVYAAAFFASAKEKVISFSFGLLPLLVLLTFSGGLLLLQPDTDTFAVLFFALTAIFFVAGGRFKQLGILCLTGLIALSVLVAIHPYLKDRFLTFFDPAHDPQGSGYQIQQSLIAIGSGGFFGRGFGQSVQKFSYLPEPIGDSIFAVAAEEFGFVGAVLLVLLFLAFCLRGLRVAANAPDTFARLLVVGIVILIGASACINIASMLGLIPLSGLTLPLVSHGGSALVITLAGAGIVLNISRFEKRIV